jgi:hypothetical protein
MSTAYHSSAAEQQALVSAKSGVLRSVSCQNANAAARFLHIYDLNVAVTAAVSGVAEVRTFAFTGLTGADLDGDSVLLYGRNGGLVVWFSVDATEPTLATDLRTLKVEVDAGSTAAQCATAFEAALDAYLGPDGAAEWTASTATATVTVTDSQTGAVQNAADRDSTVVVTTTVAGVTAIPSPLLSLLMVIPLAIGAAVPIVGLNLPFRNGLVLANSTTAQTYTAGSADSWFTAVID